MPTVLASWKEIASYLGKGVRTVQRWELTKQLPVHRPAGADQGIVIAFPAELDRWTRVHLLDGAPAAIKHAGSKDALRWYEQLKGVATVCSELTDRAKQVRATTAALVTAMQNTGLEDPAPAAHTMTPLDPPARVEVNAQRRYLDANRAACELLGYNRQEFCKLTIDDVAASTSATDVPLLFSQFAAKGEMDGVFALKRKDGQEVWVRYEAETRDGRFLSKWTHCCAPLPPAH